MDIRGRGNVLSTREPCYDNPPPIERALLKMIERSDFLIKNDIVRKMFYNESFNDIIACAVLRLKCIKCIILSFYHFLPNLIELVPRAVKFVPLSSCYVASACQGKESGKKMVFSI
jgi:hypothetical protein